MAEDPGEAWWPDEEEYQRYLECERRLFALALTHHGGMTPEQAKREALERYPYEPPDTSYRGMIFHEIAWHWAMIRLHGHEYSRSHPELRNAPESFRREAERLHG